MSEQKLGTAVKVAEVGGNGKLGSHEDSGSFKIPKVFSVCRGKEGERVAEFWVAMDGILGEEGLCKQPAERSLDLVKFD